MARPTTPSYYEVFGGLSTESGSELHQAEAREMVNLYIRNRGQELQRRKGTDILLDWGESGIIDGLEWVRIDGTNHLMAVVEGDIVDAFSSTGVVSGGTDRFSSWPTVNGAHLNRKLYLGNGVDQNVRWDGDVVKQIMPSQPSGAPTLSIGPAGNLTGIYQYKVTFVSADGIDSEPSDASAQLGVSADQIAVSGIVTASGSEDIQGRRLWRTEANGSDYYLVTTISDNVTTVYMDNLTDALLTAGTALEEQTVRFPPCRYLVTHQERLVGAYSDSDEGDLETVYVSNFQEPESCPIVGPLEEIDNPHFGIRIPVEDEVTGLASFGNVLLVWTAGSAFRLIGDNPNNWSFDRWVENGCVAHRSIAQNRNILLWLGPDGVYMAEGWNQVTLVSDPIRDQFEDSEWMEDAHAFIWDDRYYLILPGLSKTYYYDLKYRVWGELESWVWKTAAVGRNTGESRERIFATDTLSLEVWELETGTDDNGETIQIRWASKDKDLGHFGREKRIHRVIVAFKAGTGTATVSLYRSGELLDEFVHDVSDVNRTGSEISVLDDRPSEGARDEYFRLAVEAEATGADFRMLRAGFHFSLCT